MELKDYDLKRIEKLADRTKYRLHRDSENEYSIMLASDLRCGWFRSADDLYYAEAGGFDFDVHLCQKIPVFMQIKRNDDFLQEKIGEVRPGDTYREIFFDQREGLCRSDVHSSCWEIMAYASLEHEPFRTYDIHRFQVHTKICIKSLDVICTIVGPSSGKVGVITKWTVEAIYLYMGHPDDPPNHWPGTSTIQSLIS